MESQLMRILYEWAVAFGKLRPWRKGQVYGEGIVVCVLLWAALHDRPICWACRMLNWHGQCPFLQLPSPATMSRRLRTIGVWLVLTQLFDAFNCRCPASMFKRIEAHPLPVGGASKDVDAARGYGAGQVCKGYKLHEIRSGSGHIEGWLLSPMRDREATMAPRLFAHLVGGGYLSGDNAYDSNTLYEQAAQRNYQLIAPHRPTAEGLGHHHHSPHRLRALAMLENPLQCCGQPTSFGQDLLAGRKEVERDFAHEVTSGMAPLPFWVRRPHRVAPWVQSKLIIHLARLRNRDLRAA